MNFYSWLNNSIGKVTLLLRSWLNYSRNIVMRAGLLGFWIVSHQWFCWRNSRTGKMESWSYLLVYSLFFNFIFLQPKAACTLQNRLGRKKTSQFPCLRKNLNSKSLFFSSQTSWLSHQTGSMYIGNIYNNHLSLFLYFSVILLWTLKYLKAISMLNRYGFYKESLIFFCPGSNKLAQNGFFYVYLWYLLFVNKTCMPA